MIFTSKGKVNLTEKPNTINGNPSGVLAALNGVTLYPAYKKQDLSGFSISEIIQKIPIGKTSSGKTLSIEDILGRVDSILDKTRLVLNICIVVLPVLGIAGLFYIVATLKANR